MIALAVAALVCAAVPALLFLDNLRLYRPPPEPPEDSGRTDPPAVSVLIPARNEEESIGGAVEAALASRGVELEIVVLDDSSEDSTAAVVAALAGRDGRVRLETAPPLPAGWCGKQHACAALATHARHPLLVFVDADVRLAPDALARVAGFVEAGGADLASGFPRQVTGTWLEKLVIPLIHFVLLGFLPLRGMRRYHQPAFSAGCGQLMAARRRAYEQAGGHGAIRSSLHDGVKLPRTFRRAGLATDLFDATGLAACRMYHAAGEVWRGLAKNATEGMATPGAIGFWTLVLGLGQVAPPVLLAAGLAGQLPPPGTALAVAATALSYLPRLLAAWRFRQSLLGALLHPVGVLILLAIQWYALGRSLLGRPASWKGRSYSGEGAGA